MQRPSLKPVAVLLVLLALRAGAAGLPSFDLPAWSLFAPAAGPRIIQVVHETAEGDPKLEIEFNALRNGQRAEYLASKKHVLDILDKDTTNEHGQPAKSVTRFAPYGTLPELVIATPDGKVIYRGPFESADKTIELVKANGG